MNNRQIALSALFALALLGGGDALAACNECGTVVDLRTVTKQGEASGGGAILGGVVGGVLGHQIGSGRGNTAATVVGAAGGAYAGHQIEKNAKTETKYQVVVKMDAGNERYFNFTNPSNFQVGDKVKIVDKQLVRR